MEERGGGDEVEVEPWLRCRDSPRFYELRCGEEKSPPDFVKVYTEGGSIGATTLVFFSLFPTHPTVPKFQGEKRITALAVGMHESGRHRV